jgi:hypothetical protein
MKLEDKIIFSSELIQRIPDNIEEDILYKMFIQAIYAEMNPGLLKQIKYHNNVEKIYIYKTKVYCVDDQEFINFLKGL